MSSLSAEEIKIKINEFFNDTTRTPRETLEGLEDLRDEIEIMIESLESDGVSLDEESESEDE